MIYSSSDLADEGTDTFHIEPMPPITTSFKRPSSSSALSAPQRGTCSPPGAGGLVTSSLGRRPAVAREPAPSCGVVQLESGPFRLRRNSFTAAASPLRRHPAPSMADEAAGYDVTNDTGSDVIDGGEAPRCRGWGSFRSAATGILSTQHEDCRFETALLFFVHLYHNHTNVLRP